MTNINLHLQIQFPVLAEIDLSDADGSVQRLPEKQSQNASAILQQRGEYILLRVESKCSLI